MLVLYVVYQACLSSRVSLARRVLCIFAAFLRAGVCCSYSNGPAFFETMLMDRAPVGRRCARFPSDAFSTTSISSSCVHPWRQPGCFIPGLLHIYGDGGFVEMPPCVANLFRGKSPYLALLTRNPFCA